MVLQETYEILDAIFYDKGTDTSYNSNWTNINYTVARDTTGTTLTDNQASGWVSYRTPSIPFPTTGKTVIEFDIESRSGGVFCQLIDSTGPNFDLFASNTAPFHVKLEIDASTIKKIVAGSTSTYATSDYMDGTPFQFFFATNSNGAWWKYSNFKVYIL